MQSQECRTEFREELRQALGGRKVSTDDMESIAEVMRETSKKVFGVSSGQRKEGKELGGGMKKYSKAFIGRD